MAVAVGTEVYNADATPVLARGCEYTQGELDHALQTRVAGLLRDDAGTRDLRSMISELATTDFDTRALESVLSSPAIPLPAWRVGEALAEAYIVDHRQCEFPWPGGRDLKNPASSPAGTDLVGFQQTGESTRFAFGEVKTSEQEEWPPSAVTGRHGLADQLSQLRDSYPVKCALVRYLGFHAMTAAWRPRFLTAAKRFFSDPGDVSLFGVLIRDVQPKHQDLSGKATSLATGCPGATSIELRALYLPTHTIGTLAVAAVRVSRVKDE
jgi:hypothetical protein